MIHKVMNCKDWEDDKFVPGSFGSCKVDGVRAFYYPDEPYLISRDCKRLRGFDHIVETFKKNNITDTIDMEIWIPGFDDWNKMAGIIRNHNLVPEARATILDIPSYDVPHIYRLQVVQNVIKLAGFFDHYNHIRLNTIEDVNMLYTSALDHGYEGIVIKTPNHEYRNTRSYDWMRKVPFISEDVEVIDVYEGKGKMSGMAGGFYFDLNGKLCKCGTMKGMTHEDREEMWWNADDYIGRIAEVHFKEYQPSGKPRQPRFKGWRDDK